MNNKMIQVSLVCLSSLLLLAAWFHSNDAAKAAGAAPTVRYVAVGGQCGGRSPCYAQVQTAVDVASSGDEIRVAAGTYTRLNGSTQVVHLDKSITLRGGYHPQTWLRDPVLNKTILDAQNLGRVLHISGGVAPLIEGLRLTNGSAAEGGGVYVLTATVTLRQNEIYSNTATDRGGGIYLVNSRAAIVNNQIYSNTTGSSGRGGGVALLNSPATLDGNTIAANRAFVGGGIELRNTTAAGGAVLRNNTIRDNTAFDYQRNGTTFDGAGGGIEIGSVATDRLEGNVIRRNTAAVGGGVDAFNAPALFLENTIQDNHARKQGGGLYVQEGRPTINANRILSNTTDGWGGGLALWMGSPAVNNNTFKGNSAGCCGGGIYGRSSGAFDGNLFLANTTAGQGGGIYIYKDSHAVYRNTVINGNQAAQGGGIYLSGAESQFVHATFADNSSGDGRAVMIDKYPGLAFPDAPEHVSSTVGFTNTLFADQTVGIFATAGNTVRVDGVLWHDTPTPIQAAGAILTRLHEHTGDPAFMPDGYHLGEGSAARDRGVAAAADRDVDGQLRPVNHLNDLGADEAMLRALVDPAAGGRVTYEDPEQDVVIDVLVPGNAVTTAIELELAPLPPPPTGTFPVPNTWLFGPPFSLNFLLDGMIAPTLTLTQPATVTVTYSENMEGSYGIGGLSQLLLMQLMGPGTMMNAACGPETRDLPGNLFSAPICQLSSPLPTSTVSMRVAVLQSQTGTAEHYAGAFAFVAEPQRLKVYLPRIIR